MTESASAAGLEGVVAGTTEICSIHDGLRYRGYDIADLAEHSCFEEVAYLLLHGELPNAEELSSFTTRLGDAATLPTALIDLLRKLPPSTSPMNVLRSGVSLLAHWDRERDDNSRAANISKAERLLIQIPLLITARHRIKQGKEPVPADPRRSLSENLLWMLFRREPDATQVRGLDISLILYAEHEFNASTFTARIIASTLSDLHSAVTGAIGALKGELHGGANEKVMDLLANIENVEAATTWIEEALANKQRIMGFGHRVYKEGDPRAELLAKHCRELAATTKATDYEAIADAVESVVYDQKKLRPNLDWPCARLYHYLGLPIELYTPLFVVGRLAGWSAHVIEQHENNRLIRPRAAYSGPENRNWTPLETRRASE